MEDSSHSEGSFPSQYHPIPFSSLSNFPSVVFWHWLNQSFNAVVNYTNRSGDGASNQVNIIFPIHIRREWISASSYFICVCNDRSCIHCSFPQFTRQGYLSIFDLSFFSHSYRNRSLQNASGIGARLIPFSAVALANAINIPFMRSKWVVNVPSWSHFSLQGAAVRYRAERRRW